MYPKIYESNEQKFESNGLGTLTDVVKVRVTEERNGGFYLEMDYPIDGKLAEEIKRDRIVMVAPNPIDKPQPFRVYDVKKSQEKRMVSAKANHITFDDSSNFLIDFVRNKTSANIILEQMTANREQHTPVTYSTDITTPISVDWSKKSPTNAIAGEQGSFIQAVNSEIKRDGWKVTVNANRGRHPELVFRNGKDLTGFDLEEDTSEVVTKIYPYKTYKPEGSDEDKTITLPEKFVVSPLVNKYPFERIAYLDLSQDETVTDEEGLRKASKKKFTQDHVDEPKISGTLKAVNLSKNPEYEFIGNLQSVLVCDYVQCVSNVINEKCEIQVSKTVYDPISEDYESIDVGMKKLSLAQSINNTINSVKNDVQNMLNKVEVTIDSDGVTTYYSDTEPTEPPYDLKEGDIWFQKLADGRINSWMWDDGLKIWKPIYNNDDFDHAMQGVEDAKKQAQEASDKADAIENNFNTQIGEINHNIDSAKQDAQDAINQANIAIGKADFNNKEITDLKQKQDEAGQKISSIEQNYNGLKQTVTDNAAKQESDRVQLSGMIADKVSNGEFNSYKTQTADKMSAIITNTNNLFVNSSMELLPLEQSFAYITNPDKVAIIDNPFKDFPELKDVVIKDGFSYVNNKSPKILKIQRGGKVTTEWFKVVGGTKFFAEFDFYSNTGSGWQIAVVQEGENGWWATSGGAYTFTTFDQDKWSHWRYSFDLLPQCTRVKLEFYPVGGNDDSITYFDNLVCMKGNVATSMVQQTQSSITELVQNQDSLNKRVQTAEGTISNVSNEVKGLDSKLTQTADLIKGEVSSLDEKTKASLALLQDNINLKVDKDGVISQINVSPEGVLIDGDKIHLTGQTTIDNAIIPSAAIKDLSADKITTGTLNASNVNIANLDVNKLTGDYSQFLKTAWKDNNSYSEITPDGLKFYREKNGNWKKDTYLSLYSSQLTWRTSADAWHYINQSDSLFRNNLTIGAVTDGASTPASINVRSSGYDTMTSVNNYGHYSGKYTFVGSLTGTTYSDGMSSAANEILRAKQPGGLGSSIVNPKDVPCYSVRVSADNAILMNVNSYDAGKGVYFTYGSLGEPIEDRETRIVYQSDQGAGTYIKSIPTYNRTYSYSSNMFVTSNGYFGRATSAKKYKQDIEYIDNIEEAKRTLGIQPAEWADKKVMEHRAKSRSTKNDTELSESLRRRYIGFIADDFADAGFEKLVLRDDKGEVEEFQYDRLSVYHHQMIKDLYNQIDELKEEIQQLKQGFMAKCQELKNTVEPQLNASVDKP